MGSQCLPQGFWSELYKTVSVAHSDSLAGVCCSPVLGVTHLPGQEAPGLGAPVPICAPAALDDQAGQPDLEMPPPAERQRLLPLLPLRHTDHRHEHEPEQGDLFFLPTQRRQLAAGVGPFGGVELTRLTADMCTGVPETSRTNSGNSSKGVGVTLDRRVVVNPLACLAEQGRHSVERGTKNSFRPCGSLAGEPWS